MTTTTVWLNEAAVAKLMERLEAIEKRAKKLNVQPPTAARTGNVRMFEDGDSGFSEERFEVEVTGEAPRLSGWQFCAVIQHEEAGNIIRIIPGADLDGIPEEYRTVAPWCDWCQKDRNRKDTYIIYNAAGYKQVGGSCLKDFLGGASPTALANYIEALQDMVQMERFNGGMGDDRTMLTEEYLMHTAAVIRKHGWVPAGKAMELGKDATKSLALDNMRNMRGKVMTKRGEQAWVEITGEDAEQAAKALDWVQGTLEPRNDFENNLKVACAGEYTKVRNAGIVAAALAAYDRAHRAQNPTAAKVKSTQYVGRLGEKIRVEVEVVFLNRYQTDFGWKCTNVFRMADGTKLVWRASGGVSIAEVGQKVIIQGTVKRQELDKMGEHVTELQRVKEAK